MAFTPDNVNFHTYDPERQRRRAPYYQQLMIASLSLIAIATQGCSMENIIEEHERVCKQNMKVIVHDEKLWREYRAQSEAAYQKEILETPPMIGRTYYIPIGEFEVKFGERKTDFRANIPENKIVREDVFIMKGGKIVAQIVDFIAYYKSIDGPTGFNCLHLYKNLNLRENENER
jgi:hypothetical protein